MSSLDEDDEIEIKLIEPQEPKNEYWSFGALIFKNMTKEEFENEFGKKINQA